jgi:hypothetical protein
VQCAEGVYVVVSGPRLEKVYQPALTEALIPFIVADSGLYGAGMRFNGRKVKMDKVLTCGIWGDKESYSIMRAARHRHTIWFG